MERQVYPWTVVSVSN